MGWLLMAANAFLPELEPASLWANDGMGYGSFIGAL